MSGTRIPLMPPGRLVAWLPLRVQKSTRIDGTRRGREGPASDPTNQAASAGDGILLREAAGRRLAPAVAPKERVGPLGPGIDTYGVKERARLRAAPERLEREATKRAEPGDGRLPPREDGLEAGRLLEAEARVGLRLLET